MPRLLFNLADEIKSIGSKLIPNWLAFLIQLVGLILLIVIIFIFAYKPVKAFLNKRSEYMENEIKEIEENKKKSFDYVNESHQLLSDSQIKANNIINEANQKALKDKELIIEETNKEVIQMKLNAQKDIEEMKLQAKEDIHNEMVEIALDASEHILKREVNSDDNNKLAEDFIKQLDS